MSGALQPITFYRGEILSRDRIDNFIPQVWVGEVRHYRDRKHHLAMATKTMSFIGKKGDTFKIPLVGRAGVRNRIPGQPVFLQARTPGQYEVKIDMDKESSFGMDKIVEMQSQYQLRSIYTKEAGYAMSRDLDNYLLGLRAAIPAGQQIFRTTGVGAGTVAGTPAPVDNAMIMACMLRLMESDVPLEECRWIMSPSQAMDCIGIDKFISNEYKVAELSIGRFSSGIIGTLYGLPVHVTNNVTDNTLVGYIAEEGAAGTPTPGVLGSDYLPTQDAVVGTGLPRGQTGAEVANPFQTGMLLHPEWALLLKQSNVNTEAGREPLLQMDYLITSHCYGGKMYRTDHCVLFHTRGSV